MSCNSGWGNQGHVPCEIFLLQQIVFLCQFMFVKIKRFHNIEVNVFNFVQFFASSHDYSSALSVTFDFYHLCFQLFFLDTLFLSDQASI